MGAGSIKRQEKDEISTGGLSAGLRRSHSGEIGGGMVAVAR